MGTEDKPAFRLDCGAVWLNLLATKGRAFGAHPEERLSTPARFGEWLERVELPSNRPPTHRDLRRAWQLRETLRVLALSTVDNQPPPPAAAQELADFLSERNEPIRLSAADRLHREHPATPIDALRRIALQATDQLTGADRLGLKTCPEHDCRGVFIDTGGRRRWCPSPACATRGRVRAHRARLANPGGQ